MIQNQPDQWNLYLLGLERFKETVPEKMPLSFFELAGKSTSHFPLLHDKSLT